MKNQKLTVKAAMIQVLSEGKFLTLHEIRQRLVTDYGIFSSETSISASWREIQDFNKQQRVRAKSHAHEYRLQVAA